jgi:hypothetical protein
MAMAGVSGNRMVDTGGDSKEPSQVLRVDSGNRLSAATMGGEGLDDALRCGRG